MAFELDEIIPWGRSFDGYRRLFAQSDDALAGRTLGCGDGPASFNAEATEQGLVVISCDPLYAPSSSEIERRVNDRFQGVIDQVRKNLDGFVWYYFHDPAHLGQAGRFGWRCSRVLTPGRRWAHSTAASRLVPVRRRPSWRRRGSCQSASTDCCGAVRRT
jgi:hypothetical protein